MGRVSRKVEREPDGSWVIAPDHLERAAAYEMARAKDRPVIVETLSAQRLDKLVDVQAATWIDRELVADNPEPLRDAGFGREARDAMARRRQWLVAEGLAEKQDGGFTYRRGLIAGLQRREMSRGVGQIGRASGRERGGQYV